MTMVGVTLGWNGLESEGFSPITLRDDADNQVLFSFGGTSFPFAVCLDGDNNVVARTVGNLDPDSTLELWKLTAASQDDRKG